MVSSSSICDDRTQAAARALSAGLVDWTCLKSNRLVDNTIETFQQSKLSRRGSRLEEVQCQLMPTNHTYGNPILPCQ